MSARFTVCKTRLGKNTDIYIHTHCQWLSVTKFGVNINHAICCTALSTGHLCSRYVLQLLLQ